LPEYYLINTALSNLKTTFKGIFHDLCPWSWFWIETLIPSSVARRLQLRWISPIGPEWLLMLKRPGAR
jgi:hypothetical protein